MNSIVDYGHGISSHGGPDPSSNNMPLQFSGKSGPKVIEMNKEGDGERKSSDRKKNSSRRLSDGSPKVSQQQQPQPQQQQMWEGMAGPGGMGGLGGGGGYQNPMMNNNSGMMMMGGPGMGMGPGDPSMGPGFGMGPMFPGPMQGPFMGPHGGMGPMPPLMGGEGMGEQLPRKPVLHFTGFTLFPPSPHQGAPPVGERFAGCKTIFVGGQPQNMTVEMLQELFTKHGGTIINIRQGKRIFCHIRFEEDIAVDNAMFVSGYRVRIGANIDPESNGRLRIDYAKNRDDQYEFECDLRRRAREQRHATRDQPPFEEIQAEQHIISRYSPLESSNLLGRLKDGESFPQAANMLVTWLERGECEKRNASSFYNMVQTTHMHVRRLIGEKAQCDLQINQMQQQFRMQVVGLITQYTLIEQVLMSACKQRAWDHFSKAQRKNIETWKQQTKELRQQQQDELGLGEKGEAEMELSDEEDKSAKRIKTDTPIHQEQQAIWPPLPPSPPKGPKDDELQLQVQALMHQNSLLRTQLEEASNKTNDESQPPPPPGSSPSIGNEEMETQIKALQHSLLKMQQQLQDTKNKCKKEESLRKDAEDRLQVVESENQDLRISHSDSQNVSNTEAAEKRLMRTEDISEDPKKAHMIGLLSIFLNVHPFGASTEYLWSYMQRVTPSITMPEIEALMNAYPNIFRQELFGVGATLEKRWRYIVFSKFTENKS